MAPKQVTNKEVLNGLDLEGLDIRGKVNEGMNITSVEIIGKVYGTFVRSCGKKDVYIGQDNRKSSPDLADAFIKGVVSTGCHVIRLGLVPTPIVYYAANKNNNAFGAIITASHLSMNSNGLKFCQGNLPVSPKIIKEYLDKPVEVGKGTETRYDGIGEEYADFINQKEKGISNEIKMVVDCQNGATSDIFPRLLKKLGIQFELLHGNLKDDYPFDQPNPEKTENLRLLQQKVLEIGADLGIALDGDGDRMGVIDDKGNHISIDRIVALFAQDILLEHDGGKIIFDVLCSMVLKDTIVKNGGVPIEWQSGHAYIKEKLHKEKAILGGENSGHIFFSDRYPGYDDGIYASIRLLELLSRSKNKLSSLDEMLPKTSISNEERPECPQELKTLVVQEIRSSFEKEGYEVVTIDGVKVYFDNGWGLIRAASTEPKLSLRFEATTYEERERYHSIFWTKLKAIGNKYGIKDICEY
jgi:phosphomannomutase / phosphoglucomutase